MFMKKVLVASIGLCAVFVSCGRGEGAAGTGVVADLTGHWNLIGSVKPTGRVVTGTLDIDTHTFVLEFDGTVVAFSDRTGSPMLSWANPWQDQVSPTIGVTHTSAAVGLGVIPLALGGTWEFDDPQSGATCSAALSDASFLGQCFGLYGQPRGFPSLNATVVATRTSALPSSFGALGGTWQLTSDGGGACVVTISGSSLKASCAGTHSTLDGTLDFTLGDNVGSGISNLGLELSATRQ